MLKKIVFNPEDGHHYMIEIVQYQASSELKIIAYNVQDMQEAFTRTFEGHHGRNILQKFGYDVAKFGNAVKLLPKQKKIVISNQQVIQ